MNIIIFLKPIFKKFPDLSLGTYSGSYLKTILFPRRIELFFETRNSTVIFIQEFEEYRGDGYYEKSYDAISNEMNIFDRKVFEFIKREIL